MARDAREAGGSLPSLLRHSLNYSLVPLLGRVISLVMVPVYIGVLETEEYGAIDLADLWLAALVQLIGSNLVTGMQRFYFDHPDPRERSAVVSSCTLLIGGLATVFVLPLLLSREWLGPLMIGRPTGALDARELVDTASLALLIVPFQLIGSAGLYHLQILGRSGTYAAIQLSKLLFELSLRIYLVVYLDQGAVGYMLPTAIGEGLLALGLSIWTLRRTDVLRPIVRYSLPLIPVGVFQLGLHYGDRRLLEHLAPEGGLDQVGIYGLGYKLGFLVVMAMLGPFVQTFHPWIYGVADPALQAQKVSRVSTYGLVAMSTASLLIILFGRQGVDLMAVDPEYRGAWKVVPLITCGYILWCFYHISQIPLYLAKRTAPLVWMNGVALCANVGLNFWLVPRLGFVGCGLATLLTFTLLASFGMYTARSVMAVPFEYGRLGRTLGAVFFAALAAYAIDGSAGSVGFADPLPLAAVLLGKGLLAAACGRYLWRRVLGGEERRAVLARIAARLRPRPAEEVR
jgi:O-antigen/teichoic acid export membrane protein